MDQVFEAQFRTIQRALAADDVIAEVAWTPGGEVDYLYEADRMLVLDEGENLRRVMELLDGAAVVSRPGDGLVLLATEGVAGGRRSVPELLDVVDRELGDAALTKDGLPRATPNHILHITRLCPAVEPEVPSGQPAAPWPPRRGAAETFRRVLIGVVDTGLLADTPQPWMAGVTGEIEDLGPVLPSGLRHIEQFTGHGTFAAGAARCTAPEADVHVTDHFSASGAEVESKMIAKIVDYASTAAPQIINLSAGTYTRNNWGALGFASFPARFPDVLLVAAAGNDATDRPFYPAAFDWALAVGAVGPDQVHRAWFSNYGPWVNVYALGEGLVDAYATGTYTYREPPRRPAVQNFAGLARWDGTSFAAPLVAGMIGAHLARTPQAMSPGQARDEMMRQATPTPGVGPVLGI